MYDHTTQVLAAIACGLGLIFATAASAQSETTVPAIWQSAQGGYDTCAKTGGAMPEYFQSVSMELDQDSIMFLVRTKEHGTIPSLYQPDGLIRRGLDYHHQEDGTVLADLPSHEASFWDGEHLIREEVTYLPDGTFVMETNRLWINATGELHYELYVGGTLLLAANCSRG